MQRSALPLLILTILMLTGFVSCKHEITVDYPSADTQVVIDGQISNENVIVRISHTRPMSDSTKNHFIDNAAVWIGDEEGTEEQLCYDAKQQCYLSPTGMAGTSGHTYYLRAIVEGQHYEAQATMPPPAIVDTIFFRWTDVLHHARIFFVCVKGQEPLPDERNYFLCRLLRGEELFVWNPRSGRSNKNGRFEYDILCATESDVGKDFENADKEPLADGDTLHMELLSIDRDCWQYFHSLQSLVSAGGVVTNPITNIRGGALGVFVAANITRPDTLVFDKETLLQTKQ